MKAIYLIFIISLFLSSCIVIQAPRSVVYSKLSESEKALVKFVEEDKNIEELEKNDSIIYSINGHHINRFIKKNEKVLVYEWKPYCRGSHCYSLMKVQDYCSNNKITLLVVALNYDMKEIRYQNVAALEMPLFSVNIDYYKTDRSRKYTKLLEKDMLKDIDLNNANPYSVTFLFSKGKLIDTNVEIK